MSEDEFPLQENSAKNIKHLICKSSFSGVWEIIDASTNNLHIKYLQKMSLKLHFIFSIIVPPPQISIGV